jgi:hypothetical protein
MLLLQLWRLSPLFQSVAWAPGIVAIPLSAMSGEPDPPTIISDSICDFLTDPGFQRRTLTAIQKREYIQAVQCLQKLPATTSYKGVKTRFDDFQALHMSSADKVHLVVSVYDRIT